MKTMVILTWLDVSSDIPAWLFIPSVGAEISSHSWKEEEGRAVDGTPAEPQACFVAKHFVSSNHSPTEHENNRRCSVFPGLDLNFINYLIWTMLTLEHARKIPHFEDALICD